MTWQELIKNQIEKLEKEKIKETKRLDKVRDAGREDINYE